TCQPQPGLGKNRARPVTMGATPPNPEGSLRVPPSRWGLRPQTPRDRCASLRHDGGYAPKPRGIAARPSVTMGATPPNPEGSLRVPPSRWGLRPQTPRDRCASLRHDGG